MVWKTGLTISKGRSASRSAAIAAYCRHELGHRVLLVGEQVGDHLGERAAEDVLDLAPRRCRGRPGSPAPGADPLGVAGGQLGGHPAAERQPDDGRAIERRAGRTGRGGGRRRPPCRRSGRCPRSRRSRGTWARRRRSASASRSSSGQTLALARAPSGGRRRRGRRRRGGLDLADVGVHVARVSIIRRCAWRERVGGSARPRGTAPCSRGMTSAANSSRLRRVRSAGSVPSWNSAEQVAGAEPLDVLHQLLVDGVGRADDGVLRPRRPASQVSRDRANWCRPFSMFSSDRSDV